MRCTASSRALVPSAVGTALLRVGALPALSPARPAPSAIYRRRLTVQAPLRGHRPVAARLSKIP